MFDKMKVAQASLRKLEASAFQICTSSDVAMCWFLRLTNLLHHSLLCSDCAWRRVCRLPRSSERYGKGNPSSFRSGTDNSIMLLLLFNVLQVRQISSRPDADERAEDH